MGQGVLQTSMLYLTGWLMNVFAWECGKIFCPFLWLTKDVILQHLSYLFFDGADCDFIHQQSYFMQCIEWDKYVSLQALNCV